MNLVVRSRRDMGYLLQKYGNSVILYNPTISYNEEGDDVYILGSGTSTKMLVFPLDEETVSWKFEGLDVLKTYRVYLSHNETISKNTIFSYGDDYYTVYSFAPIKVNDKICFYDLVITATKIRTAKRQTITSDSKIA